MRVGDRVKLSFPFDPEFAERSPALAGKALEGTATEVMENSFTLLLDLHKRVGLLLQDLDEAEVEEPRWNGMAELHAKITRYLLNCGFEVDSRNEVQNDQF